MAGIRRAVRSDLPAIVTIYNQAVVSTVATFDLEPKTVEAREPWFAQHDERFSIFVTERFGQLAGWSALSHWSERPAYANTCEISLYVEEGHRRKGIGRELMQAAIEHAERVRFHTILSRVASENAASIRLHDLFGFRRIGTMREVGFKFGRYLDVDLFQLMLPDGAHAV